MTDLERFLRKQQQESHAEKVKAVERYVFWKTQYARHLHGQPINPKARRIFDDWKAMQPRAKGGDAE